MELLSAEIGHTWLVLIVIPENADFETFAISAFCLLSLDNNC